jgi:hypothetical protein
MPRLISFTRNAGRLTFFFRRTTYFELFTGAAETLIGTDIPREAQIVNETSLRTKDFLIMRFPTMGELLVDALPEFI